MVLTDSPWAVWAWRLASSTTFWLAHDLGRCTRVASPSTHTASPERAISASHWRSSSRVVMNVPSGWQYPMVANSASSRSMLSPTSVLEIPTARPARRYDSPSRMTAATASRRTSKGSGGVPPRPGGRGGRRWARRSASQASTSAGSDERGQYDNGDRTSLAGVRDLAYGLVPVNVRTCGASRTPSVPWRIAWPTPSTGWTSWALGDLGVRTSSRVSHQERDNGADTVDRAAAAAALGLLGDAERAGHHHGGRGATAGPRTTRDRAGARAPGRRGSPR